LKPKGEGDHDNDIDHY